MSNAFIGQIDMFGGNYAPFGWAFCNGQLMSIVQNTALFSLIGTTYGGDGITTFALPDLRSRLPLDWGQGPGLSRYELGQASGTPSITLSILNLPAHNHTLNATTVPGTATAVGMNLIPAQAAGDSQPLFYCAPQSGQPAPTPVLLAPNACGFTGASAPHSNLMPSLCVTFIIALQGIFPSRS